MNKFLLGIQGYISCFGWMFAAIWNAVLERSPDLKFWDPPKHPGDFIWYAERVNGRLAMLTLTALAVHKYLQIIYLAHHVD